MFSRFECRRSAGQGLARMVGDDGGYGTGQGGGEETVGGEVVGRRRGVAWERDEEKYGMGQGGGKETVWGEVVGRRRCGAMWCGGDDVGRGGGEETVGGEVVGRRRGVAWEGDGEKDGIGQGGGEETVWRGKMMGRIRCGSRWWGGDGKGQGGGEEDGVGQGGGARWWGGDGMGQVARRRGKVPRHRARYNDAGQGAQASGPA